MKKFYLFMTIFLVSISQAFAQTAYNPFTQNIHFTPEPTVFGYECGSNQQVVFTAGLTTAADATQWQSNPLTITVCIAGFEFNGLPANIVSGSYAANFTWAGVPGNPNCIIGTQNQTLVGTGPNPLFPNPASSGPIVIDLKVPTNSPVGTILSVNVTMQVPAYMSTYNSVPDDNESTQTQTFCNCYALTDPGIIGSNQSFCVSGDPAMFTNNASPSGGSGGVIEYQWQIFDGTNWIDIPGATSSTYDASTLTVTTKYRRNSKRSLCGSWLSSNEVTVTVNPNPVANAGTDKNLNCTTTSATIGTTAISGNTYSWSPATGLSATNIAQPIANPSATTTYTVTVTNSTTGCSATDVVIVNVNTTPPTANAGPDKNLNCTTTSTTIGTTAISGNTYSWAPATGLNATNIAQPTANPSVTTNYTVTVTAANGCTATDVVSVDVNTTPPTVNAGSDKTLTCVITSTTIGTFTIGGNTYSWAPATGLSATNIAQPTASPTTTTNYTITVTGANGCTATDVVTVTVDVTPPTVNAGPDKNLNCTTTSTTIGTTALSGYTYQWGPSAGLSATNIAQPTANPTVTTTYTVVATGANGCTASDVVIVNVNTTPPTVDAGTDKNLNCTTTSSTIGTTAISGNTYSWAPATGLSATNVAQPTANPSVTTTYTVTVTGANGCTATDVVTVNVNTTPPTANAGTDKNLNCTTTSTTIGTTAISGNTYSWAPATGLNAINIAQPIANPSVTTTYTVTVTGTNGCTATDVVIVNVNTTPPTVDAGTDKNLNCTTTSSTIGTTAISGNTYSWAPSTGLSATNVAQPTANPSVTTTYTVTVTGANGCTATDVVIVNVNTTPPTADAGTDKNLNCTTTSTTIGTTAISGNTYSWAPATGLSATNVAQPTANPSVTTTYTVTVTGTNGCTSTDVVIVNVNTTPPSVDAGTDKNLNCTTTSSTIGTIAISGNTYSWAPATGLSATNVAQPTANPSTTTTYTVTVTGANGCTATDVVTVNVNTTPPTANAGIDKNLNCITTSTTIGTTAISGNTYSWAPATGLSATNVAQPTTSPNVTTSYTVTVTSANGCTATDVVVVNVNDVLPIANAGPDHTVCSTTSAVIGTTALSGNTYSWAPATGLNATNIAQPTATPSTTTNYTVTVTNSNGCTSTDVVTVFFKEGSIGNYVWTDVNGNGLQDEPASMGINGVTVNLYSTSDNIIGNNDDVLVGTQLTANFNSNPGYYNFKICDSGSYYVSFPTATTTTNKLTTQNATAATDGNSDANTTTGYSPIVVINPNGTGTAQDNPTIDAGYVPLLSLGNLVWIDADRNGLKGSTESGLLNATVKLYYDADSNGVPDGASIASVTVGANGLYVFNDLLPGKYVVGVTPPTPASGNPYISSINGQEIDPNLNVDNNDNGINTVSGETFSGTVVLLAGTEPLNESPNNGTAPDANSNLTVDFGFYQPVNISGNVFVDNNGPTNVDGTGIGSPSGTPLYANLADPSGNVIATVPVNPNGTYQFVDVTPNTNYTLTLSTTQGTIGNPAPTPSLPLSWNNVSEDCCDNIGNDGNTNGTLTLSVGNNNLNNANFGITQPLSLGNMVFADSNKNGLLDPNEGGINNATVYLYQDADSNGVPDGPAIMTTTTTNGLYIFNGLTPGNYVVGVMPPSISNGSYTSSTAGEEANPNLNGDGNDNGIVTNGGITYSGTITLAAGTEPLGELPNNGASIDMNSNLTLDFAFFICPSNFVFNPITVCAGTTIDLHTVEPAGFTGGTWTQAGNPITNYNVSSGNFVYTYQNGTCIATGVQKVDAQIPDYAPTIAITPGVANGITNIRVIVTINELLNMASCTPVYVFVPRLEPRYIFTWNPTATQFGAGIAGQVNNVEWQYFTSNPNFYIWQYIGNSTFPPLGQSKFGYVGTYNPNNTDGVTTFSVQIYQGSGGEINLSNNTDSENLLYFRQ
ncbi:MAG: SdrD B-like domain-containing protein [Chitinophagaceae bacterium]